MLSPVYWDIRIYRMIMFLLYGGGYASRYSSIFNYIKEKNPKNVLELCFGDVLLARFCQENSIQWLGVDRNTSFINYAKKKGFNVLQRDLTLPQHLPDSDLVVISGALYHFNDCIDQLFETILKSSDAILISEHVINFNTTKGQG